MKKQIQYIACLSALLVLPFANAAYGASSEETEDSRAVSWANETGEIAGGATFCMFDIEEIENFISRAQSKVAAEAKDDVDLVVARIAFTNTLTTSSIREPIGGCQGFRAVFDRENQRLN